MIYAEAVIMYRVYCPTCDEEQIVYREDVEDKALYCEECGLEFVASLPEDEVGELIFDDWDWR